MEIVIADVFSSGYRVEELWLWFWLNDGDPALLDCCMAEGYLKPSLHLVLRGDRLASQFLDCFFGPVRCNGVRVSPRYHMKGMVKKETRE